MKTILLVLLLFAVATLGPCGFWLWRQVRNRGVRFALTPRNCLFALLPLLIGCEAPTNHNWQLTFLNDQSQEVVYRITTRELYSGHGSPRLISSAQIHVPVDDNLKNIGNVHRGEHRRIVNGKTVAAGPGCSGSFKVSEVDTGQVIGRVRTGNSYSSLWGISPCGEYLAYFEPGAFFRRSFIQHIGTGQRAQINVSEKWIIVSWEEIASDQ
jgi:hypothetical protein